MKREVKIDHKGSSSSFPIHCFNNSIKKDSLLCFVYKASSYNIEKESNTRRDMNEQIGKENFTI